MYNYTDSVIKVMRKKLIQLFNNFNLSSYDELHVINAAKALYAEADVAVRKCLLTIARIAYIENGSNNNYDFIDYYLISEWLSEYNPVSKYSYVNEVDRKCSRFYESLLASTNKAEAVATALRYFSNMATWYAIDVTDKAVLKAYKDEGVEKVVWITTKDERTCQKCSKHDGKVYSINKIPPKPHINCRCYFLPVIEKVKKNAD